MQRRVPESSSHRIRPSRYAGGNAHGMGRVSGRARRPTGWVRYAWALFAVVLALLARWFADPRLGPEQVPYGSMLVATMVVAWFVGLRPALVVVFIGGPA